MTTSKTILAVIGVSALILGPLSPIIPDFGATPAFAKNNGDKGGGHGGGKNESKGKNGGKSGQSAGKVRTDKTTKKQIVLGTETSAPNAHGKIASELKGLNAYHASETAFANASPDSQVGRIAAYREAALQTLSAEADLADAKTALEEELAAIEAKQAELDALDGAYDGRSLDDIDADIAALDPNSADYDDALQKLNDERQSAADYEAERAGIEEDIATSEAALEEKATEVVEAETTAEQAAALEEEALMTASGGRTISDPALEFLRSELGL